MGAATALWILFTEILWLLPRRPRPRPRGAGRCPLIRPRLSGPMEASALVTLTRLPRVSQAGRLAPALAHPEASAQRGQRTGKCLPCVSGSAAAGLVWRDPGPSGGGWAESCRAGRRWRGGEEEPLGDWLPGPRCPRLGKPRFSPHPARLRLQGSVSGRAQRSLAALPWWLHPLCPFVSHTPVSTGATCRGGVPYPGLLVSSDHAVQEWSKAGRAGHCLLQTVAGAGVSARGCLFGGAGTVRHRLRG